MHGFPNVLEFIMYSFQSGGVFERWQTLIAGLIAIGAAFIGGHYINKQITASDKIEADKRRRKFAAARAALPLTLSSLSEYARKSGTALQAILSQRKGEEIPQASELPEFPSFPVAVIEDLRAMIEFGDDNLYETIAMLLGEVQLQSGRLKSFKEDFKKQGQLTLVSNIEDLVLDTALIYARAASLFDFARRKSETYRKELTHSDICSALNNMSFWSTEFGRIHATAERRYASNDKPVPADSATETAPNSEP